MKVVIKKRVSLDFLGEDYKEAYLVFNALPLGEYARLIPKFDEGTKLETINVMLSILKDKFIEGKFPEDGKLTDVAKDDLDQFDEASLAECFSYITGQKTDPKV